VLVKLTEAQNVLQIRFNIQSKWLPAAMHVFTLRVPGRKRESCALLTKRMSKQQAVLVKYLSLAYLRSRWPPMGTYVVVVGNPVRWTANAQHKTMRDEYVKWSLAAHSDAIQDGRSPAVCY